MIHVQDVAPNTGDSNERMMEEQRMIRWIEEDEDEADRGR
jgi:hypothetical protein